MKIAIDIDGVLVDLVTPLLKFHNEKYGTNHTQDDRMHYELEKLWGGTRREAINKVLEFYESDSFKNMKPMEGVVEAVKKLSKEHELHIVTARVPKIDKLTDEWVNKHFEGIFDKIHHANRDFKEIKSDVCKKENFSLLIDDNFNHVKDCSEIGMRCLLFDQPWNRGREVPENVQRVFDWDEIVRLLQ